MQNFPDVELLRGCFRRSNNCGTESRSASRAINEYCPLSLWELRLSQLMSDDVDDNSLNNDVDFMTPEDLEKERIFFDLLFDNLETHAVRYREQAQTLIKLKEIESLTADLILNFSIEDGGFEYNFLEWTSVDRKKTAKIESIMQCFASREARITLEGNS